MSRLCEARRRIVPLLLCLAVGATSWGCGGARDGDSGREHASEAEAEDVAEGGAGAGTAGADAQPPPQVALESAPADPQAGSVVVVVGDRFQRHETVLLAVCRVVPDRMRLFEDCDPSSVAPVEPDDAGRFEAEFTLRGEVGVTGLPFDCAAEGSCVIAAATEDRQETLAETAVHFAPAASDTADDVRALEVGAEVRMLDDGSAEVDLRIAGGPADADVIVVPCVAPAAGQGPEPRQCNTDISQLAATDGSGSADVVFPYPMVFFSAEGDITNCATEHVCQVGVATLDGLSHRGRSDTLSFDVEGTEE